MNIFAYCLCISNIQYFFFFLHFSFIHLFHVTIHFHELVFLIVYREQKFQNGQSSFQCPPDKASDFVNDGKSYFMIELTLPIFNRHVLSIFQRLHDTQFSNSKSCLSFSTDVTSLFLLYPLYISEIFKYIYILTSFFTVPASPWYATNRKKNHKETRCCH